MSKSDLIMDLEGTEFDVQDDCAILRIKSDLFKNLTDLTKESKVFSWFDQIAVNDEIKAVFVFNDKGTLTESVYNEFLSDVTGKELDENCPECINAFQKGQIRAIEINMLISFARKMINLPKLVVSCLRGEIVTPFFGTSLTSDIRLLDKDSCFSLSHVKYGLHPSGGLPFFLPKFVGNGVAMELLLQGGKITAEDALELGLVNEIIDSDNFEQNCISYVKENYKLEKNLIKSTKDLFHYYKKDLYKYFDHEETYLYS
ncbi:MAG: enoyl-CoA hydratase/isomerase family protein [Bacteroidetes bacterium]|nr:enoyl-CoA hydratase/isomerase family protein [Bacteroidota bacterium]